MNKRNIGRNLVAGLAFAMMVSFVGLGVGCSQAQPGGEQFLQNLRALLANNPDSEKVFRLKDLTPFTWTELQVWRPYSAVSDIVKSLAPDAARGLDLSIEQRDDAVLLMFLNQTQVAETVYVPRELLDFYAPLEPKLDVSAAFRVVPSNAWLSGIWLLPGEAGQ